MQAEKKQIEVATPAPAAAKLIVEKLAYPPEKQEGKLYTTGAEAADEVVRLLREEAKVI